MKPDVIIIGAGLSGLSAAVHLQKRGKKVLILESSSSVGGRVKTDLYQGFRLDRGFQVLLTAYPEAKALLDYEALKLKKMLPGATILYDGGMMEIADPFRRPSALMSTLLAPVGSLRDKINTFFLKVKLQNTSIEKIFSQAEKNSNERILDYGFSPKMISLFYAPFLSGIYLENNLNTSGRMFDFVMKMFSDGDVAIPALGMQEIPKQLLSRLPIDAIQYHKTVVDINGSTVSLYDGTQLEAKQILIATHANDFSNRFFSKQKNEKQQVTNVYFEASEAPTGKAIVVLNASKAKKWVNNLTVLSNVSKDYAPEGKVLISVSLNGIPNEDDATVAENMKLELLPWFGKQVKNWKLLKTYRIPYALPNQQHVQNDLALSDFKIADSLFICGDHLLNGSINAAFKSGRLVAEAMSQ